MGGQMGLISTIRRGEDLCFALQLDHLHPDRSLQPELVTRDGVALVTALEGQRDARFVLQTLCLPDVDRPERGRLEVHLIVALRVTDEDAGDAHDERIEELRDDLMDLLGAPPLRWSFSAVADEEDLRRVLDPIDAAHFAEIARREEPCTPTDWRSSTGFGQGHRQQVVERELWSMWTLGPTADDIRRVASVLLAQESPVCIRVVLEPSCLTDGERSGLEQLVMQVGPRLADGLQRTSLHTLESLLYLRPLFDTRFVVASEGRLSPSLLSALGHAMSEPSPHGPPQPVLSGGFAVLRGGDGIDAKILAEAFGSLSTGQPVPSLAPEGLERLRRLLGPWEAANVFRIPVGDLDGVPGLQMLDIPDLPPPVSRLAHHGRRLGRLVGHGELPVLADDDARFRHTYVSGQTGTGKSTLLLNLAMQDVLAGDGVAVLDPHGDLVEALLARIPDERIDDVVLVDPADRAAVVGVNLLEAESAVQADYIVEELSKMFCALFDPNRQGIVGPRFETMLRQAANLLMAHSETQSSMLDIVTVFTDEAVRKHLIADVQDPVLAEYWLGEMLMPRSNEWQEVISWFRSKFEIFRTSRLVRKVVGQSTSSISFSDVLDRQQILLVNLSKGLLGEYNSALIGHIVFARLWSAALERGAVPVSERAPFHIYIDEFQNMTNDSLPSVLSEARKFRVSLTLANQFFTQIPELTRDAIMGNVGSRVTFRLGPKDAEPFSQWLGRDADPHDLATLPNHIAVAGMSERGIPLPPFALRTDPPASGDSEARSEAVRARSREQWARPVDGLDEAFFARWRHVPGSISAKVAARREPTPVVVAADRRPDRENGSAFLDEWLAKRGHRGNNTESEGDDDD